MTAATSTVRVRGRDLPLFEVSVAASLGLHALAWAAFGGFGRVGLEPPPSIEVDLNAPFKPRRPGDTRLPGAAKGAPAPGPLKTVAPAAAPPPVPVLPSPAPPLDAVAGTAPMPAKEKPWVLPGPNTEKTEKPVLPTPAPAAPPVDTAPGGSGPGGQGGKGGTGGGTGTGDALVTRPPRLINVEEIRGMLRRYYPERERMAGREGRVVVALSIGSDGKVGGVDVLQSAGSAFDGAAKSVGRKMIFEPALVGSVPTAVKARQTILFQLKD